jgi:hypothetical protein
MYFFREKIMDYTRYLIELNGIQKPTAWEKVKQSVFFRVTAILSVLLVVIFAIQVLVGLI